MIISRSPVRITLGGGGTDLPSYYSKYGGALIAAAIDKYTFVTAHTRFDNDIKLKLDLRDYQNEIVGECVDKGRGVVMLATAGGKTLTMANLLERGYAKSNKDTWKVLVIVPDLGLVNQTYSDFENYEVSFSFSKWTGNNDLDITSNVVIANLGILQSEKTDLEWEGKNKNNCNK